MQITRVSTDATGGQANGGSALLALSADGTKIAFTSGATNLVVGDTNGVNDVFVKNLLTGAIVRISTGAAGEQANGASTNAAFSPDGTKVAFSSTATNLVAGDTNGVSDIFVKDLATGAITRISTDGFGLQGNNNSLRAVFSPDGTKIAFGSAASNFVADDTNGVFDVFLKDLASGAITRISTSSSGGQAPRGADDVGLTFSPDGTKIAFISVSSGLVDDDTNNTGDIFVKNLVTGVTTRISTDSTGQQGLINSSIGPVFSPDGNRIVFQSLAANLVAGDVNGWGDIFIKNLVTGATTLVSTNALGAQLDGNSGTPSFSADGNKVAFFSGATNAVPGDTNGQNDIFVKDLLTGAVTRISVDPTGRQADDQSLAPRYLPDGNGVAFLSFASNLVVGDTNGIGDLFVVRFDLNTPGNDTQTGTAGNDYLYIDQGGSDTVATGGGNDGVFAGTALDSTDRIIGAVGAAVDGQVIIQGNYTATLTGPVLTNMQTLAIQSGSDARWGDSSGALYSYAITLVDSRNVAAGATLTVNANTLRAGETLFFDGTAETDGAFRFYSGSGDDTLRGGAGNDIFYGRLGADTLTGGGGNDVFHYRAAVESAGGSRDTITDFSTGDRIDLAYFDANSFNGAGTNDAFSFIGAAPFTPGGGGASAGQLRATNVGANWLVEGDTNGDGVADFSLLVTVTGGHVIVATDFVL